VGSPHMCNNWKRATSETNKCQLPMRLDNQIKLEQFFGCICCVRALKQRHVTLATAVAFIHFSQVRNETLLPSNGIQN
jgi:hypothetical protein